MIKFDVRKVWPYWNVNLHIDNTEVDCGLFDDVEAVNFAKELLSAAEDILPPEENDFVRKIQEIREAL